MKNWIYLITLLALSLSILIFSCSKETGIQDYSNITSVDNDKGMTKSLQVLPDNPLEQVGIEHNLLLEIFVPKLEQSHLNNEWENIVFLSEEYKEKFSLLVNESHNEKYPSITFTTAQTEQLYDDLLIYDFYDGGTNSELDVALAVLDSLATNKDKQFTANFLRDLYLSVRDSFEFKSVSDVINHHEILILSEEWNENEMYALGSLAVAKHSLLFWSNYDFDKFNVGVSSRKRPFGRDEAVVLADTAGYVVGGVTGSLGGSFLGPAGTVGGWFGGKLAGSFVGSGAALTAFGIYDAFSNFFNP